MEKKIFRFLLLVFMSFLYIHQATTSTSIQLLITHLQTLQTKLGDLRIKLGNIRKPLPAPGEEDLEARESRELAQAMAASLAEEEAKKLREEKERERLAEDRKKREAALEETKKPKSVVEGKIVDLRIQPYTEEQCRELFPNLTKQKEAVKKINDFRHFFANNLKKVDIRDKKSIQNLYTYPAENPVLATCACGFFTFEERLLLTLKQINALIEPYPPNETPQIVHTSFASGSGTEEFSELLQLFMFIKGLLDFGYTNILVKTIDPIVYNPKNLIRCELFEQAFNNLSTPIDVVCCTGGVFGNSGLPYIPTLKKVNPLVVILSYTNTKQCINQIALGAPKSNSFDIIDSTEYIDKKGRDAFIQCITITAVDDNAIIYEGHKHVIESYHPTNLTKFMIKAQGS